MIAVYVLLMVSIWEPARFICGWRRRMKNGGKFWRVSVRVGWKRSVADRGGRNDYFAFPALYAAVQRFLSAADDCFMASDSRGASIEFRNHIKAGVDPLWDFLFCASSLLLAVFFGAALGNVVRGVPLDASGYFFEPLWTNFRWEETGILDWYTILVGVLALLALAMHARSGCR